MIHTSKQLKDKIRNISKGDNDVAKALIRTFMMERFLERVSLSKYRNNFILKGGMLVASIVGVDMRATMDIDTTVKELPLNENDAERIISEICSIPLEDGVTFSITSVTNIMTDFEYPGIRMIFEAKLDRMRQSIKLDISTDDVITLANTRMRDFYDVYGIVKMNAEKIDKDVLIEAFHATCEKRETVFTQDEITDTLSKIKENEAMAQMWEQFRRKNFFVGDLQWDEVICDVLKTMDEYILMYF